METSLNKRYDKQIDAQTFLPFIRVKSEGLIL